MNLRITPKFSTSQLQHRNDQSNLSFSSTASVLSKEAKEVFGTETVRLLKGEAKGCCGKLDAFDIFNCAGNSHPFMIRYTPDNSTENMQVIRQPISNAEEARRFMQEQHTEYSRYN